MIFHNYDALNKCICEFVLKYKQFALWIWTFPHMIYSLLHLLCTQTYFRINTSNQKHVLALDTLHKKEFSVKTSVEPTTCFGLRHFAPKICFGLRHFAPKHILGWTTLHKKHVKSSDQDSLIMYKYYGSCVITNIVHFMQEFNEIQSIKYTSTVFVP